MERTIFEDEHEQFRASFRRWVDAEIVPHYLDWEKDGIVPREVFTKAGEHGFLGMSIPEEYGGGGVDDFRYNLVIGEEVQAAGVGSSGLGITLHNDICLPYFLAYCTDEQKARWLPGIASGELITAIACVGRLGGDEPVVLLTPCGICQERLIHFGADVQIAVPDADDPTQWQRKLLREVQPFYWVNGYRQIYPDL